MKNLRVFLLMVLGIQVMISCSKSNDQVLEKLKLTIEDQIKQSSKDHKKYGEFHLKNITNFEWDRFFVFDEYVTNKQVSEITGLEWNGPSIPSDKKRILFINKKQIVQYVDYTPESFRLFISSCDGYEFRLKDELFAVLQSPPKDGGGFNIIPKRCVEDFLKAQNQ